VRSIHHWNPSNGDQNQCDDKNSSRQKDFGLTSVSSAAAAAAVKAAKEK